MRTRALPPSLGFSSLLIGIATPTAS